MATVFVKHSGYTSVSSVGNKSNGAWSVQNISSVYQKVNGLWSTAILSGGISTYAYGGHKDPDAPTPSQDDYTPGQQAPNTNIIYVNEPGAPNVVTDEDGKVTAYTFTDVGSTGVTIDATNAPNGINTGIVAFDGKPFRIHAVVEFAPSSNTKRELIAVLVNNGGSNYTGFHMYGYSSTSLRVNSTKTPQKLNGGQINNFGSVVGTLNVKSAKDIFTLDIYYTPSPNKSFVVTLTPISTGSDTITATTNVLNNYIPDNLEGANIALGGSGIDTSFSMTGLIVHEFSVSKT